MFSPRQQARQLFTQAYQAQMRGDLEQAVELYSRSIDLFPTAEAYTFRGWAYSFRGEYDQAIEECLRAIELDPAFGNPYNDIGAYLIEKGRLDEAVPWLEKAAEAPHYASPFFALFNLGRIFERKRQLARAQAQYRRALASNPGYTPAQRALQRIQAQWN
ncbi:MAG TPA: tetratricopeptide repeat protein [Terriglobales bacterium]|nr:tetratricopeptide repeat protein [Terriglobales bacterium]